MPTAKLANLVACFKWKSLQRWGIFLKRARDNTKKHRILSDAWYKGSLYGFTIYFLNLLLSLDKTIAFTKAIHSELESGVIISLKRFFISFEESLAAFIKSI